MWNSNCSLLPLLNTHILPLSVAHLTRCIRALRASHQTNIQLVYLSGSKYIIECFDYRSHTYRASESCLNAGLGSGGSARSKTN